MIIELPADLVKIEKVRRAHKRRFAFNKKCNRMILPRELVELFPREKYGIDIWVSQKEQSAFLRFVPKEKAYYSYNNANGYIGCADLFRWLQQQDIPIHDDYDYEDYQVDTKNKVVQVKLVRK